MEQGPETRVLLAKLDSQIIKLEEQERAISGIFEMLKLTRRKVTESREELMILRDYMRPVLDSSAPKDFPYDKR